MLPKIILGLFLAAPLLAEEIPAALSPETINEIRDLLNKMKARAPELEKLTGALSQMNTPIAMPAALEKEAPFNPEECGQLKSITFVQQCVIHSVRELRKLSEELE